MPETKLERFKRLAPKRVDNAIKAIQLVGNLSTKITYEYTDADIRKIFSTLDAEVKKAQHSFRANGERKANGGFTL